MHVIETFAFFCGFFRQKLGKASHWEETVRTVCELEGSRNPRDLINFNLKVMAWKCWLNTVEIAPSIVRQFVRWAYVPPGLGSGLYTLNKRRLWYTPGDSRSSCSWLMCTYISWRTEGTNKNAKWVDEGVWAEIIEFRCVAHSVWGEFRRFSIVMIRKNSHTFKTESI